MVESRLSIVGTIVLVWVSIAHLSPCNLNSPQQPYVPGPCKQTAQSCSSFENAFFSDQSARVFGDFVGFGLRVQATARFRVLGLGFWVLGLGFRVSP